MTRKSSVTAVPLANPSARSSTESHATGVTQTGDAPSQSRSVVLTDASAVVGASWAHEFVDALRASGRPIEGGWPGTLPEARARIVGKLSPELSAHGLLPLDAREIGLLASSTNAEAKRSWHLAAKRAAFTSRLANQHTRQRPR